MGSSDKVHPGTISANTTLAGVIGQPVRHSLSPLLHNSAFAATGVDGVYLAFEVAPWTVAAVVEGARRLGVRGLNVTMPHKAEALSCCTSLSERAIRLSAVNTLSLGPDGVIGDSTDGPGFVAALRASNVEISGLRCAVVGAGGAARAVTEALADAGADRVTVVARRPKAAEACAALAGAVGRSNNTVPKDSDLVVNGTPLGMAGTLGAGELAFDVATLGAEAVVVDLVYQPLRTPVLEAAAARGLRTVDGLGMLVHQAALSFATWWGTRPPVEVMSAAARSAIS